MQTSHTINCVCIWLLILAGGLADGAIYCTSSHFLSQSDIFWYEPGSCSVVSSSSPWQHDLRVPLWDHILSVCRGLMGNACVVRT